MSRKKKREEASVIEEFQAIGFNVGEEEYGLAISSVAEIITTPHITRVPKAPEYIKGVINLHGNVIPVFDIASCFKIGETKMNGNGRIVVVEVNEETVGIAAESVSNVTRLPVNSVKPPPPLVSGIAAEYLDGVARLPDRFLIFLNLEKVLASENVATEQ